MAKRTILRFAVLFSMILVTIAGVDFYLRHRLAGEIKRTATVDD